MKVGDKVVCKKVLGNHFIKDNFYEILSLGEFVSLMDEFGGEFVFSLFCDTSPNVEPRSSSNFYIYFYSKKELRKKKLDEIESW